jgi:hypothetical protein
MSIMIPFTGRSDGDSNVRSGGVLLPLRLGLGTGAAGVREQRDQAVLRALAAAAALSHTADSLTLAREAQQSDDDLGARFTAIEQDDLRDVLDELARVQNDRSALPSVSEEQRVVASAAGADPVLVAAAQAQLVGNDQASLAARQWAAVVDAPLLERAARAAARRELVRPPTTTPSDIQRLEQKIDDVFQTITKQLTELTSRVSKLEGTP